MTNKKKKNTLKSAYAAIIVFIVTLATVAIIFGRVAINNATLPPTVMMESGILKSNISSDSSGKSHSLEAKFSVELDRKGENSVDKNTLFDNIQSYLKDLDYDKVSGYDGIEYIKEYITARLDESESDKINLDAIEGIYITALVTDASLPVEQNANANSAIRGLFKNIK